MITRALCRGLVIRDMPWRALYWGAPLTSFVLLMGIVKREYRVLKYKLDKLIEAESGVQEEKLDF